MKQLLRQVSASIAAVAIVVGLPLSSEAVSNPVVSISFSSISKAVFGDPDIALTLTQAAGITTVSSLTPDICSMSSSRRVHIISAGVCKLEATNPGTANFKPAKPVIKSFTIARAQNVLTISDFAWLSMTNSTGYLSTSQSAGITVLTSTTTKICSIDGTKVVALKIGTCTVRATNSGTSNYGAAKSVTRSVKVGLTSMTQPPVQVGPWTIRQTTFDDSNSYEDQGSADSWVANKWYHKGLSFRQAQLEVLSTTTMSYLVTDGMGRPTPNKLVNLSVGKRFGSSNAKVQVGNGTTSGVDKNPLDQLLVTGTTNSEGVVSFDIKGLDTVAKNGLYTQIAAWVTDLAVDTIDITNLEYSISTDGGNSGGELSNPDLAAPKGSIDSLFYQPCTGIALYGQIAAIDVDPANPGKSVMAVTRGRPDAPSGLWDSSVLTTLPQGNFVSSGSKLVTVDVYSPAAGVTMMLRLQNSKTKFSRFVQTQAVTTKVNQWETLSFDFNRLSAGSQAISPSVSYKTLSLIVDAGHASTGQKYFFKNFQFPGALINKTSLTTASTDPVYSQAPAANGSYLWAEEFNGVLHSKPSSDSWKYALDWNNFIQGTQPDLVEEDGNGNLAIGMAKCSDGSWNGGIIQTLGRKAFLYGKIEARIKVAQDPGWFSAFYMFGEDVGHWPTCGEFDIQEAGPWNDFSSSGTIHGNYLNSTTDWNNGAGFSTNVPLNRAQLSSGYHVFGLLWTPTSITFTLDDVPYKTFTKAQVVKDGGTWPFDVPEFLVFSVYPYESSLPASAPAGTILRGQVLVDWIHYSPYQGYGQLYTR